MTAKKQMLLSIVAMALLCLGGVSCVQEMDDGAGQAMVSLTIGTSDASSEVLTRATDERALDGEQIHSLLLFVVNSANKIEKKLQPDLSSTDALSGELESWTSPSFRLKKGIKQVYAFANWESLDDDPLAELLAANEKDEMPSLPDSVYWKPDTFDPANDSFLPMSAQATLNVQKNGQHAVELVRLVSRLQLQIINTTPHDVTLDNLSLGYSAQNIALFGQGNLETSVSTTDQTKDMGLKNEQLDAAGGTKTMISSDWFYLGETHIESGFQVTLESSNDKGHNHGGTRQTVRKEFPRNHTWVLELVIADYELSMTLKGENPPIGGYPEVTSKNVNGLVCTLYGGGLFELTDMYLKPVEGSNSIVPDNLEWKLSDVKDELNLLIGDLQMDGTTISGRMVGAAKAGQSLTFNLSVYSNGTLVATFPITLTFDEIFSM